MLQRTRLTFEAVSKQQATQQRPEGRLRRQAVTFAHLLRGHALQSIRSTPPKIDGMDVAMFAKHLDDYVKVHSGHPDDHLQLCREMHRAAHALAITRGSPNWANIRCKASVIYNCSGKPNEV